MSSGPCVFCGQNVELIQVHGHYQCPVCKTNAMPCCDGDNCDTNVLLSEDEMKESPNTKSPLSNIQYPIS